MLRMYLSFNCNKNCDVINGYFDNYVRNKKYVLVFVPLLNTFVV